MRLLRASSVLVLLAGAMMLAAAAQAQNRAAPEFDDTGKDGKRSQTVPVKPGTSPQLRGKDGKDGADESDMILLQEPFRSSPMTPVSVIRRK